MRIGKSNWVALEYDEITWLKPSLFNLDSLLWDIFFCNTLTRSEQDDRLQARELPRVHVTRTEALEQFL